MKMLTIMLLGIFLASCNTIKPLPIYQYSYQFNNCRIYCFDYNKLKRIADSECGDTFISSENLHPRFCDGVVGPYIDDYATDIKPTLLENIQACKDK